MQDGRSSPEDQVRLIRCDGRVIGIQNIFIAKRILLVTFLAMKSVAYRRYGPFTDQKKALKEGNGGFGFLLSIHGDEVE